MPIMSERREEFDLLKWHPELILISKSPYTFEGFLSLPKICNIHGKIFIKIKLIVPFYPNLDDMTVYFTENFKKSFKSDFQKLILNSLQNRISLHSFLNHLKEYFILQVKNECVYYKCIANASFDPESMKNRLNELRELLQNSSEIKVSSTYDMKNIKLTTNDISIIVQNKEGNLWKIINSDIPNILDNNSIENTFLPLNSICNIFISKLDSLKRVWCELKEIDSECWVIDPIHPKPHQLYRRIYLSDSLSLMMTLDHSYLSSVPNVKLVGCESEVVKYRENLSDRIQLWDCEYSLLQNLYLLLDIIEFPQAPEKRNDENENIGIINDEECCICFENECDDQLPNIICNNTRCRKNFHSQCLRQWLESATGKPSAFNQIYGECPHCHEKISCTRM
ncbi:E3 ubiquitin-protein ligase FANCL [Leptopilina boulardi]|uniref:E3 ubiquitin-protein ligase FANCL n=1 Tax=Leptopilina boulardi TaxID=63433 RepID=UPI0021F5724C|nr:E3 ubiquitin-protein ligase FANCL [Leptopilina boulardi]